MTDTSTSGTYPVPPDTTAPHPLAAVLATQERSARWLAFKTGKSPSYVTLIVKRKRRPSADFRARAAATLNVPESLLFPDDEAA